jgi:hypothetical protein
MSLILDALNRSRQNDNPVPGLATHHPVEPLEPESRRFVPWVALVLALLLIAWLLVDRYRTPAEPDADIGAPVAELSRNIGSAVTSVSDQLQERATAAESTAAESTAAPTLPAAGTSATAQPTPQAKPDSQVAGAVVEPTASIRPAVEESAEIPAGTRQGDAQNPQAVATVPDSKVARTQSDAAIANLYANRDAVEEPVRRAPARATGATSARRDEQPVDIDKILMLAQQEAENVGLDDHPVPLLASLSQSSKDAIPTIYYQQHDFSSDSARSEVVLNGKPVRAGGSPMPGLTVEEILPDSVVLNYKGTQFRLRALNSWVNL